VRLTRSTWNGRIPDTRGPPRPRRPLTVTSSPSGAAPWRSRSPHGRDARARAADGWRVRKSGPPLLVTMAPAVFITGSQSGVVVSETRTSPGLNSERCSTPVMTRAFPAAIRSPTLLPVARSSPVPVPGGRSQARRASAGSGPSRAGLDDEELIREPVLRHSMSMGTGCPAFPSSGPRWRGRTREPEDLVVADRCRLRSASGRRRSGSAALPRPGVDELHPLVPEHLPDDRSEALAEGRLEDVELVGVDRALDDVLTEAVRPVIRTTSRKPVSVSSVKITPLGRGRSGPSS